MNQTEPKAEYGTLPLDEGRWRAWALKNRELDTAGAVRRLRFLKTTLVLIGLFALLWNWMPL